MYITKFQVNKFGKLNNFNLDLSSSNSDKNIKDGLKKHFLIGQNGSGKSTFFEALIKIFASFELPKFTSDTNFDYEIEYFYAGKKIHLKCYNFLHTLSIDDKIELDNVSMGRIKRFVNSKDSERIFPKRIISFYSGHNDRAKPVIERLERNFKKKCLNTLQKYYEENLTEKKLYRGNAENIHFPDKKYIRIEEKKVDLYLLAILALDKKDVYDLYDLDKDKSCTVYFDLDLAPFAKAIHEILRKNRTATKEEHKENIKNFFFELLSFIDIEIAIFLQKNCKHFILNIEDKKFFTSKDFFEEKDFFFPYDLKKKININFSIECIEELCQEPRNIYDFLEKLESIFNAKIKLFLPLNREMINTDFLSEGQRQYAKLLGISVLAKNEECLVLIDEIDAHMNPRWKYELNSDMTKYFEKSQSPHILLATHDPLVINGINKESIRIFEQIEEEIITYKEQVIIKNNEARNYISFVTPETLRNNNPTKVKVQIPHKEIKKYVRTYTPTEATQGMGIDGILQSEYYGLKNSYDKATADKFQKRQELYLKLVNGDIEKEERTELRKLSEELGSLPFAHNTIDFIFDDFMLEFKKSKFYSSKYLSREEFLARQEEIQTIIKDLFKDK